MADRKITQLDPTILLTGEEFLAIVQPVNDPKNNKKITLDQVRDFILSSDLGNVRIVNDWDASINLFPVTGGSAADGTILKGNVFRITVPGTLKDNNEDPAYVVKDALIMALASAPGQFGANWRILS